MGLCIGHFFGSEGRTIPAFFRMYCYFIIVYNHICFLIMYILCLYRIPYL